MTLISLQVNGKSFEAEAEDDIPLLWFLRDHLKLVGTKYGCGISLCGSCTVLVDSVPTRACSVHAKSMEGKEITTIEGLAEKIGNALGEAWVEHDTPQCGYCQAGQIMSAAGLLISNPNPTDEDIDIAMAGNVCRCGSYTRIRKAIKTAARKGVES